jgi:hypothetical protein
MVFKWHNVTEGTASLCFSDGSNLLHFILKILHRGRLHV